MLLVISRPIAERLDGPCSTRALRVTWGSVLGLSLLAHLTLILFTQGAAPDIHNYLIQAQTVFDHRNVYDVTREYPYPPVWIWLVAGARWLASASGAPFYMVVKLPGTLADFGITFVLYELARARHGVSYRSALIPALYALNPVVLLISAGHGQFDALVIFFLALAIYLKRGCGLALGVAIALKGFPLLFLPYFLQRSDRSQRPRLFALALLPLVVSMLVYTLLFGFTAGMIGNVIGYRSTVDFGWQALLLDVPSVASSVATHPVLLSVFSACSFLAEGAIIACAVVLPTRWFPSQPAQAVALVFAAWFATTMTMSAQYTLWILPFLCLALPLEAVAFSVCALVGILAYYAQPLVRGALLPLPQALLTALSRPGVRLLGVVGLIVCSVLVFLKLRTVREPVAEGDAPPPHGETPRNAFPTLAWKRTSRI